jgi:hypothetical protein
MPLSDENPITLLTLTTWPGIINVIVNVNGKLNSHGKWNKFEIVIVLIQKGNIVFTLTVSGQYTAWPITLNRYE